MSASNVANPLQSPTSSATRKQALQFMIQQALLKVQTSAIVKVDAVHGGGLAPVGTLDATPLVGQIDGAGNVIPHVTIYGRPYVRWQGGDNAIILDPKPGDLGLMVFGSRDLSAVISSKGAGPPPSGRTFSFADGLYVGGLLNGTPTSFLQWLDDGTIHCTSPVEVDITAPVIKLTGGGKVLEISSAGIVLDGITWETHKHTGVQTGGGETGGPTN